MNRATFTMVLFVAFDNQPAHQHIVLYCIVLAQPLYCIMAKHEGAATYFFGYLPVLSAGCVAGRSVDDVTSISSTKHETPKT